MRFDTEFVGLEQDADGVTALLRDRLRGDEFTIRARYLIGADGARSRVAEQIALPIAGEEGKAGSMNIVFKADLTPTSPTGPASSTGSCGPAPRPAASAWVWCAWSGPGTSGC